jgi:hypothetical protein
MNPFPFRQDAHPDLTAAIREVTESHSRAELEKLGVARLRQLKKKYEARAAKGDRDAARELADIHGLLRAKGGGHGLDEDLQTPARQREMQQKMKGAERATDAAAHKYMRAGEAAHKTADTDPQTAAAYRKAGKDFDKAVAKTNRLYAKDETERRARKTYGAGGKVVREGAQLDERIIDEVDFFQASKNLLKGKGFKTNREVSAAKVNANYAAMKARQAKGKSAVAEGCSQCMDGALKSLKAANAEDLKEKPGKAGERAHKRLHKTIAKVVGEETGYPDPMSGQYAALNAAIREVQEAARTEKPKTPKGK